MSAYAKLSSAGRKNPRLLLGHAMNRPQADDDLVAAQTDYLPVRKKFAQYAQRLPIVGIVEHGCEHDFVGDIKVRVACRQTRSVGIARARAGQLHDVQFVAILVRRALQPLIILLETAIPFLSRIRFEGAADRVRVDKSGDVVDMAIRVVTGDTLAQPNNTSDAKRLLEQPFDFGAAHFRITILIEQALLGGETGPGAVDFDGSPFEHDRMVENRHLEERADPLGDPLILSIGLIFAAPAVEDPIV